MENYASNKIRITRLINIYIYRYTSEFYGSEIEPNSYYLD